MSTGGGNTHTHTQACTVLPLMPRNDEFALSALPTFYLVNISFCKVPRMWLQKRQPLFTSAPPSEHVIKPPEHYPHGMHSSSFPRLVASRREAPETSLPPPALCGSMWAQLCDQVSWCTSPHGVIHEARGLDSGLTQGSTFCLLVQDTAASSRQPLENGCPHLFSNKTCSFTVIGEKLLN